MLAVFTTPDAAVIGSLLLLLGTFVNGARNRRDIKVISRSVNHVGRGEPTLIQRVRRLERHGERHAKWEKEAFTVIAQQLGVSLPTFPTHPSDEVFSDDEEVRS